MASIEEGDLVYRNASWYEGIEVGQVKCMSGGQILIDLIHVFEGTSVSIKSIMVHPDSFDSQFFKLTEIASYVLGVDWLEIKNAIKKG